MKKVLITGTGRCGTTFLMKIFTFLGFDTGYTRENYTAFIYKNCNAGLEQGFPKPIYYISKSPLFMEKIETVLETTKIKLVIIPVRNYQESAKSRVGHSTENGGLWNAQTEEEQITFYNKITADYIQKMVKYSINTLFLDFDQMVNNKYYLYIKLKDILEEVTFEDFSSAFDEAN